MQNFGLFCPFLPTLAILSRIYALFGILFTGLDNVAVHQNWQISGMCTVYTLIQMLSNYTPTNAQQSADVYLGYHYHTIHMSCLHFPPTWSPAIMSFYYCQFQTILWLNSVTYKELFFQIWCNFIVLSLIGEITNGVDPNSKWDLNVPFTE